MKRLLPFLLLSTAFGQNADHTFFDKTNVALMVSTGALRAVDIATTCRNINAGGREVWMPVGSCGGVAALIAAGQGLQMGAQWGLHKTNHHKLERWVPVLAGLGSAVAIGYSVSHR